MDKILKLSQHLIKNEISLFEKQKTDKIRINQIVPLIQCFVESISIGILDDQSSFTAICYNFVPGICNLIDLIKDTFRVFDNTENKEQ